MDSGVIFQPISFKTLLGPNEQHPKGLYCNLNNGRNPIFAKITGVLSRVRARSGTYKSDWGPSMNGLLHSGCIEKSSLIIIFCLSQKEEIKRETCFFQVGVAGEFAPNLGVVNWGQTHGIDRLVPLRPCLLVCTISDYRTPELYPQNHRWAWGTHPCFLVE